MSAENAVFPAKRGNRVNFSSLFLYFYYCFYLTSSIVKNPLLTGVLHILPYSKTGQAATYLIHKLLKFAKVHFFLTQYYAHCFFLRPSPKIVTLPDRKPCPHLGSDRLFCMQKRPPVSPQAAFAFLLLLRSAIRYRPCGCSARYGGRPSGSVRTYCCYSSC